MKLVVMALMVAGALAFTPTRTSRPMRNVMRMGRQVPSTLPQPSTALLPATSYLQPYPYPDTPPLSSNPTLLQPIMAGNWKLNPATMDEAITLAGDVAELLGDETCSVRCVGGCGCGWVSDGVSA